MTIVLVDEFGIDRLYNTLGIVLLFDGIASMLGPPMTSKFCRSFHELLNLFELF